MQFIKLHITETLSRIGSDSHSIIVTGFIREAKMRRNNIITTTRKEISCSASTGDNNYVSFNFRNLGNCLLKHYCYKHRQDLYQNIQPNSRFLTSRFCSKGCFWRLIRHHALITNNISQYFFDLQSIWAAGACFFLRFTQSGGSNHFHSFSDLTNIFDAFHVAMNLACSSHQSITYLH